MRHVELIEAQMVWCHMTGYVIVGDPGDLILLPDAHWPGIDTHALIWSETWSEREIGHNGMGPYGRAASVGTEYGHLYLPCDALKLGRILSHSEVLAIRL